MCNFPLFFPKRGQNKTILFKSASTGFDMWRNKAHECKGGQRGFAVISLLMEQKKKKRQRDLGKRGWIYCPLEKRIYRRWWEGGEKEREREKNQTGWPMRAHTDALCLMSRWHFCSPSPTLARWRNGQRGKARRRERERERRQEEATLRLYYSRSRAPDKVRGRGSQEGQPIRTWVESGRDHISLPDHPPNSFVCLFSSSSSPRRPSLARLIVTLPVDVDAQSLPAVMICGLVKKL